MIFEEVRKKVQPALGLGQRGLGREIRAMGQRKTLDTFEDVGATGETADRKARREQPVLRRLAGVERLAHGAELGFEPSRLRAGDAERDGGRLGI